MQRISLKKHNVFMHSLVRFQKALYPDQDCSGSRICAGNTWEEAGNQHKQKENMPNLAPVIRIELLNTKIDSSS